MNLRIIPAHPTSPTVIFSLNWHNLPSSLPLPSFYSQHLAQCSDAGIPTPRNTLAMDKAVGFHLLLESVTFDLARLVVVVAWLDKRSEEWPILSIEGLQKSLEGVLDCVRQSGEEAEKEKKAAQQQATAAKASPASSSTPDIPSTAAAASAPANAQSARERRRTASGIFSSLVASFITPPATPDSASNAAANIPAHLAHLPRRRPSKGTAFVGFVELYHAQHIMHPQNKRDAFPPNAVPQSRFLRRQARAKLVDVFRHYVAGRLTTAMRKSGILGDELKERGVLDDMDEEVEGVESGPMPGTSGFQAAGGYISFMARSMLRNALAEQEKAKAAAAAAASTSSDDSFSSSSEESLLLTPKNGSDTSLPSSDGSKRSAKAVAVAARRRSVPTPTPQARQIRQISSLLIGLTQKDKRAANDEREMLELVKERSLRRRYSLSESSSLNASTSRIRIGNLPADWNKPVVPSPLRNVEVAAEPESSKEEEITVVLPFPTDALNGSSDIAEGADSGAADVSAIARRTQSLPTPPPASLEEAVDAREGA
ncbi:hypothetical protein M407DRAFT_245179, partial [Tulasnella calospora MUT 4182]